jgi:hypothetical protein
MPPPEINLAEAFDFANLLVDNCGFDNQGDAILGHIDSHQRAVVDRARQK